MSAYTQRRIGKYPGVVRWWLQNKIM